RFGEPAQLAGQRFVITRRFLAHEHEIDLHTTQIPEGMRGQNFAHDFDVAEVTDHDDDNRQVAGNALSPERPLTLRSAAEARGLKIGSRTAPMLFVRLRVIASGFSGVRPRPRNCARSVSNSVESLAEEDSETMMCAVQID